MIILKGCGVVLYRRSPWYETAPVPASDQPWFVNGVAAVETELGPEALLAVLHRVEAELGRARSVPNAARIIDLDLLAYGRIVTGGGVPEQREGRLVLPHPRLHERRFVLQPLVDLAPDWRHPVLGRTARELLEDLPAEPPVRRLN